MVTFSDVRAVDLERARSTDSNHRTRNVVLDALRGLAALWVVLHHTNQFFVLDLGPLTPVVSRIAGQGFLGVDIFFVLSGFLITGLLLPEIENGVRLKRFYVRRFFKIVPQYFIVMLVGLAVSYGLPPSITKANISSYAADASPLAYLFFLQNFFPYVPPLGHFWSLAVEEHFYLAFPLLVFGISRLGGQLRWQGRPIERRAILASMLILTIIVANLIRFSAFPEIRAHVATLVAAGATAQNYFWETQFRIDALAFGCLLRTLEPEIRRVVIRPRLGAVVRVLSVGAAFAVLSAFIIHGGFDFYKWYNWTLVYLAAGALVVAAGMVPSPRAVTLVRITGLSTVGTWSYATYLWQGPLIFVLSRVPGDLRIEAAVFGCASIFLGAVSTITIEKRFLDVRRRVAP